MFPTNSLSENFAKAYFAGGCFWCMEESFDKVNGVIKTISGYSGGHVKNPKYKDVVKNITGHYETLEISYDPSKINFSKLLNIYWLNIDPFDKEGQFCDKGESYKSVVFFNNNDQKKLIEESIKNIEKKSNKKVVTYIKKFKEFYMAETYHQDYYEKNFIRYLLYKKGCQREETLNKIWG
jgi:methionine-S-sulfoxide reductase